MKQTYYIYIITNLLTGKAYVGQRRGNINDNYMGSGKHLHDAYKTYTKDAFEKSLLEVCTEENVNEREIYWIDYYNTFNAGYNLTEGGESGPSMPGELNPMYGKFGKDHPATGNKHSEEAKRKIGDAHRGKIVSEETRKKLRGPKTQEHKDKISKWIKENGGRQGTNNPAYGSGKPILQYTKDGELIKRWENGLRASQETGINNSAINNCLRGKSKTSGGFIWKYK